MSDAMGKRKKKKGGGRRHRANHFIDVALDGYIRDLALGRWRVVDDAMAVNRLSLQVALGEAGGFDERGEYREIWHRWWRDCVASTHAPDQGHVLAPIEAAIRGAVMEEREARKARGAPDLEDTLHYKTFVDRAMDNLLEEASGEIEDLD